MTKFLFIRHGEPDYSSTNDWQNMSLAKNFAKLTDAGVMQIYNSCKRLAEYTPELIISSPFTRTMQGATIMARELGLEVKVEHNLHEWQADLSYSIEDEKVLRSMVEEYVLLNGVYPKGETRLWESMEMVKARVLEVLERYMHYKCVIVSGHGMMTQAILGKIIDIDYGEIVEIDL